ncbi:MFS general substrate transporter [Aspergillus steynii IBT 23096]|uniref:MFS general substrate transporter n=1 Tax=Aspergillus steynii IBT 23096 TaxID=1392250 RepID=A0A2I2GH60_9EURO|nr:MFS general substrate transporter [Aspergillus steynii IBT 23096]PLB52220.1 MFS general substrate transporter [Aspergillus steynii IBT 23096]
MEIPRPIGYRWRSSRVFILATIALALFAETFLYGFVVPILTHMLEVRLHIDPSQTQSYITTLLSIHGLISLASAPIIAHFVDKSRNRKIPLLIALAGSLVGTVLVAWTPALWVLFFGRYMQGICGAATWIVSFAIMLDCTAAEDMGKTLGIVMTFVTTGFIGGPTIAGILLELVGYWATWSVPMTILILDIVARLLMIESRDVSSKQSPPSTSDTPESDETTALIPDNNTEATQSDTPPSIAPSRGFYRIVLSDARVLVALANIFFFSFIISGFEATIPLHVRDVFGWGSMGTGLMFFCLQLPSFFLAALGGMLRDRCGLKYPTALGWALLAPLFWLLGVPGDKRFPWAGPETGGKTIFPVTMAVFGTVAMLVRGAGSLQLSLVTKDMQTKDPLIFGPGGGNARAQSILEMAFSLGMMAGPLVTGTLSETVGYYYMTFTLACLSLGLSFLCYTYLDGKRQKDPVSQA